MSENNLFERKPITVRDHAIVLLKELWINDLAGEMDDTNIFLRHRAILNGIDRAIKELEGLPE